MPVLGFGDLLDGDLGDLSRRFSYEGDALHLNPSGARVLAMKIKRAMFLAKLNKGFHGSRLFSSVVSGGAGSRVT